MNKGKTLNLASINPIYEVSRNMTERDYHETQ